MDQRTSVLTEALEANAAELERWEKYREEHKNCINNLDMMVKRLKLDVMVPIGRKAFMKGELVHTNNILVSHYQDLFSMCSSQTAKEMCELRIKRADEQLQKFEKEAELWKNKLETPLREGAVYSGMEREIIEEYDEESERLWRLQHKESLKKHKLIEKQQRDVEEKNHVKKPEGKSNEEIFQLLEEAELMEEFQQELQHLGVAGVSDELLAQIMKGEVTLPKTKKRVAHNVVNTPKEKSLKSSRKVDAISKSLTAECVENPPKPQESQANVDGVDQSSEVNFIKKQADYLDKADRRNFYDYQVEIIQRKLKALTLKSTEDLVEKVRLLSVMEKLEELQEMVDEPIFEVKENENPITLEKKNVRAKPEAKNPESDDCNKEERKASTRRKISFSAENETVEFYRHESVLKIMEAKKSQRSNNLKSNVHNKNDKKSSIERKVQNNLDFVCENQSKKDFNLVDEILNPEENICTLTINFEHSNNPGYRSIIKHKSHNDKGLLIPNAPGDISDAYLFHIDNKQAEATTPIYVNGYIGEKDVKVPILKEEDRSKAYVDEKNRFSRPTKSILRKTPSVPEQKNQKQNVKETKTRVVESSQSAFNKVMSDVVEKTQNTVDPLPENNFIDTHQPRKRISHFQRTRSNNQKLV